MQNLGTSRTLRFVGGPKDGDVETLQYWHDGLFYIVTTLDETSPVSGDLDDLPLTNPITKHVYRCGLTNAQYEGKL